MYASLLRCAVQAMLADVLIGSGKSSPGKVVSGVGLRQPCMPAATLKLTALCARVNQYLQTYVSLFRCAAQAMLGDVLAGRGQSSPVNGEVVLDVDLRQPPGSYALQFSVVALTEVNTSMTVQVQGCGPGEVTVPGR
jgi:hypothetical protein